MYTLAYGDIKDSIRHTSGLRHAVTATSMTNVYTSGLCVNDTLHLDWLDWVARAPLSITQKKLVALFALGWTTQEMADDLGLSVWSARRWLNDSFPVLKGQL